MTLIAGQLFFQGLVLIADSRASTIKNGKIVPWRDNTQKIFLLSSHLGIGFAGDIEFAGSIISFLSSQIEKRPLLRNLHVFYSKGPKLIRYAYKILSEKTGEKRPVGFIVASLDPNRPEPIKNEIGQITGHIGIYDKKLFKISFPEDSFEEAKLILMPSLVLGSGEPAVRGKEDSLKKLLFCSAMNSLYFQAFLIDLILRRKMKELGIDTVGGLSQILIIEPKSSGFLQYKGKSDLDDSTDILDIELIIKNDRLVQHNLITGKETPLLFPPEVMKIKDPESDLFADLDS